MSHSTSNASTSTINTSNTTTPAPAAVDCSPIRCGSRIATLYEAEWMHILATLAEHGGNVSRTARALGLARQSLQRKLRRLPPLSMLPSANTNAAL